MLPVIQSSHSSTANDRVLISQNYAMDSMTHIHVDQQTASCVDHNVSCAIPVDTKLHAIKASNSTSNDIKSQAVHSIGPLDSDIQVKSVESVNRDISQEPVEYTGEYGSSVKTFTESILSCNDRLKRIIGGDLCFVSSGNPPFIPSTYMSREGYANCSNALTEAVKLAEVEYTTLTKVAPNDCEQYGEFVFGIESYNSLATVPISNDVKKAAEKVKLTRMKLRYFLDNKISVDLKALRSDVLSLHETITIAKHQLRALQYNGVNIGTQIFPDHGVEESNAPLYSATSG